MAHSATLKFTKKLQRVAAEIRFKPRLKSWQNVIDAAVTLEDKYPNWQLIQGKTGDIALVSPEEKTSLRVKFDTMIYSTENSASDTEQIYTQFALLHKKLIDEAGVGEIRHIGFRTMTAYEVDITSQELVDVFFDKFYRTDGPLQEISADSLIDVAFILDGQKEGVANHVRIGPMRKEELLVKFKASFDVDTNSLRGDCYAFFDIDTFFTKAAPDKALENLASIFEKNKNILEGYQSYLAAPEMRE